MFENKNIVMAAMLLLFCGLSLPVSALGNFAYVTYYTDIQCKSIIYMLDSNIVLWSIRNKNSEKMIR